MRIKQSEVDEEARDTLISGVFKTCGTETGLNLLFEFQKNIGKKIPPRF